MKDFEKFLTDLPKPAVEVPAFRARLRGELLSVAPTATGGYWRPLAVFAATAAALMLVALGWFVIRPEVPERIHAAFSASPAPETNESELQEMLARAAMPEEDDRAFVDNWTATQPLPVEVRTMEAERLFSVRQFELTDGKRMLVFTELGNEQAKPAIRRAGSTAQPAVY